MKHLTITTLALLFCSLGLAQSEGELSAGLRLGVNIANASNVTNSKSLTGLAIGLTGMYSLSDNTGVGADLLFSGEGFAQKNGNGKVKLGYLEIPIYFNYIFGEPGAEIRPKAFAGIAPAFLMSGKDEDGFDLKDTFNGVNFSLFLGGGANYQLSDELSLTGGLRFFFGLADLRDKDLQDEINVKSSNIQLSVAVVYILSNS
jgi:hypothetical protein